MLTDPSVTGEISVKIFGIMEPAIARGNVIAIASIVVYISNSFLFRLFYSMYIFLASHRELEILAQEEIRKRAERFIGDQKAYQFRQGN
jgi:hypothetical protein